MDDSPGASSGARFQRFVDLIARLRAPGGCPWDREQTHASLKPMTIEEAYEVLEAIDAGDDEELAGELGDLLLQVVFHAQIATDERRFTIDEVIDHVADKMVRRHPHVFANEDAQSSGAVLKRWEAIKQEERAKKGVAATDSMMDSVSKALPAILEAYQMTTKAGRVGFDWPDTDAVLAKLEEEIGELREALRSGDAKKRQEEVGDVLFSAVNVARLAAEDPESALKAANRKFRRRFRHVEDRLRERGKEPAGSNLEEMDALWNEARERERR